MQWNKFVNAATIQCGVCLWSRILCVRNMYDHLRMEHATPSIAWFMRFWASQSSAFSLFARFAFDFAINKNAFLNTQIYFSVVDSNECTVIAKYSTKNKKKTPSPPWFGQHSLATLKCLLLTVGCHLCIRANGQLMYIFIFHYERIRRFIQTSTEINRRCRELNTFEEKFLVVFRNILSNSSVRCIWWWLVFCGECVTLIQWNLQAMERASIRFVRLLLNICFLVLLEESTVADSTCRASYTVRQTEIKNEVCTV